MQTGNREGICAAALANAVAAALAKNLTPTEQNILGNFVTAVGASILTIAAVAQTVQEQAASEDKASSNSDAKEETDTGAAKKAGAKDSAASTRNAAGQDGQKDNDPEQS